MGQRCVWGVGVGVMQEPSFCRRTQGSWLLRTSAPRGINSGQPSNGLIFYGAF